MSKYTHHCLRRSSKEIEVADEEISFIGDGVEAGACLVGRTTLLLSEQEKPFLTHSSHFAGQTRSTGRHYVTFVSICFELLGET